MNIPESNSIKIKVPIPSMLDKDKPAAGGSLPSEARVVMRVPTRNDVFWAAVTLDEANCRMKALHFEKFAGDVTRGIIAIEKLPDEYKQAAEAIKEAQEGLQAVLLCHIMGKPMNLVSLDAVSELIYGEAKKAVAAGDLPKDFHLRFLPLAGKEEGQEGC